MKHYITLLLVVLSFILNAQNNAIGSNEDLRFTASYNMSGLLTELAEVQMQTKTVKTSKSTLLHLKCKATTYSKWDSFFKIRDLYESYVNPKTLKPYLHKRDINEGGHKKFMQYKFKHKSKIARSTMKKTRSNGTIWEVNKDVSIGANTRDIVTTIYYLRNLDIKKAPVGASDTFTVIMDNKQVKVGFKYLGKETISTNIGRKECYKLAISVKGESLLRGSNSNLLWLTADENKVPVYGKFKIAVGNGELKIKSATGLRH